MLQAIRFIMMSIVVLASLYACGGESSGMNEDEENNGSSSNNSTPPRTTVNSNDPIVLSGAEFYQGGSDYDDEYLCVTCHGLNGQGGTDPDPINSPVTCDACTSISALALEITNMMPVGDIGACIGSTPGTCAYDIAAFMMDQWITPNLPDPGVIVSAPANVSTNEDLATATITLRLNTEPTADVNIEVSSSDTTEGTINPGNSLTLTFNSTNWSTPQPVVVTGVDDVDTDGDIQYTIITTMLATADTDYAVIDPDDVIITNTDNEVVIPAGITLSKTSVSTSENATTDTFTVVLDTMPIADVSINLSSTDTGEATVSPSSLTFTSVNYDTPQTVMVTGVDDGVQDGAQAYMIVTAPAVSADTEYSTLDASDVTGSNIDNEAGAPGVTVTPTMGLITTEAGGSDTFTVVLQSMPNADVTVTLTSDDTSEGNVDLSSLTFTSANWDTAQTVTVTGEDDADIDLNQAYNISLVISSADPAYTGLAAISVSATNEDNEENVFALGKVAYELVIGGNSCATCHGSEGLGQDAGQAVPGIFANPLTEASPDCLRCGDQAMFEAYIVTNMPIISGNPLDCDATCAANITSYIYNGFSTVPPGI